MSLHLYNFNQVLTQHFTSSLYITQSSIAFDTMFVLYTEVLNWKLVSSISTSQLQFSILSLVGRNSE